MPARTSRSPGTCGGSSPRTGARSFGPRADSGLEVRSGQNDYSEQPMQTLTPGSILGHAVRRREDPRLVTGAGHYVDDRQPERCLHVAFVRSTLAHATIRSVDLEAAKTAPGVVAVLTGADLSLPDRVGFAMVAATLARAPLATERVRFVGEVVALVLAESPGQAADAAQMVGLDLEPLPVVVDPEIARRADSTLLFPEHGSNLAGHFDS